MNNLKKFTTEAEYEAAIGSFEYPNVSWVESGDTLHYNIVLPSVKYLAKNGDTVLKTVYCGNPQLTTDDTQTGYETSAMTDAIISDCVTSLEDWTFYTGGENDFASLSSVTVPNTVTQIPSEFVRNCTSLKSFEIPSGVTRIAWEAFKGSGIEELTIPSGVTEIEAPALDMPSATSITCLATEPPSLTFVAMTQYLTGITIYVPAESVSAYEEASGWSDLNIQAIPNESEVEALFYVIVPTTVTLTSQEALSGISKMYVDDVELPNVTTSHTFTSTGEYYVRYVLADSTKIPTKMFYFVTSGTITYVIKEVTVPDSVTLFETDAFHEMPTDALFVNATVPPTLESNAIMWDENTPLITVPSESLEDYKAANGWSDYADFIFDENGEGGEDSGEI